jgi:hypothetical protein
MIEELSGGRSERGMRTGDNVVSQSTEPIEVSFRRRLGFLERGVECWRYVSGEVDGWTLEGVARARHLSWWWSVGERRASGRSSRGMGRCRSIELSWGGSVGWLPRFILGRLINDSGLHYVGHRQVWRGGGGGVSSEDVSRRNARWGAVPPQQHLAMRAQARREP